MTPVIEYQCPCCDFFSLQSRGSYDVCRVCYWEDDGLDLDRLDEVSAVNHVSLREARDSFRRCGAADPAAVSLVLTEGERTLIRREVRS